MILAAAVLAAVSSPAAAQSVPCASHADALRHLEDKYAETVAAVGLSSNGALVQVVASKDGATWTILVTLPRRPTCMILGGQNWRIVPPAPEGPAT